MPRRIEECGVIMRSFAKTPDQIPEIVTRALASARKVLSLKIDGRQAFTGVLFLVPRDYDCGQTTQALYRAFRAEGLGLNTYVLPVGGHHSCGALNEGLRWLSQEDIRRAIIVSNKAIDFLDDATVSKMFEALDGGKKVVGVHIPNLSDAAESPIQNTLAGWDIDALFEVGGFDCETGVEEVAPIIRLLKTFGEGCAAIIPARSDAVLDIRKSADGQARHDEVKKTKASAQKAEAARLGVDLDWLKASIVTS